MPPAEAERRLAAILSADVAGYSRLMADDEDATVRALRATREQVAALIAEHRGRLADFTGDNFLAEFAAARDAVECALAIGRVVEARNAGVPEPRRMRFRIGAHLGDVRHEDGRLFGDGVNIAARLQPLAEPGGLCISSTLADVVRGKLAIALEDMGERALKNIPERVRAFRVRAVSEGASLAPTTRASLPRWLGLAAAAVALAAIAGFAYVARDRTSEAASEPIAPPAASDLGPIRSIAVLPLTNLSGDPEQEFFADGMTETLIAELSKLPGVRVISRTSVMQFKGTKTALPEIAKTLNVDGVIEGSVMRAGNEVRITAQLIDARSDRHLWAHQYDRELARVLEIQSEVARAVAAQIQLALTPEQSVRLKAPKPVDPRAQDAYFRGLAKRDSDDLEEAIRYFEEATRLAPEYAPAWASLSRARSTTVIAQGWTAAKMAPAARSAAERALALDGGLADSHVAMGWVHYLFDWDWAAAERELRAAADLPSADVLSYRFGLASVLLSTGRSDEASAEFAQWFAEAPPAFGPRYWNRHNFLLLAGDVDQLLAEATEQLRVNPRDAGAAFGRGDALELLGRYEEAAQAYAISLALEGRQEDAAAIERGFREGGRDGYFRAWEQIQVRTSDWVWAACSRAQVGDADGAFDYLERAFRERDANMRNLVVLPLLKPLHSDPRFADLARRMNLPLPPKPATPRNP